MVKMKGNRRRSVLGKRYQAISLQIVESSQVDLSDENQKNSERIDSF
jgi:hypothetical protein